MQIVIGSINPVKIEAVKEVLQASSHFSDATFLGLPVSSEISEQPMSLEEIIRGAKNRAYNAFHAPTTPSLYGIGLESGLFEAPGAVTGFFEACVCSFYDGTRYSLGLSCGFEVPPLILEYVLKKKMDLSQACQEAGIVSHPHLGKAEGLIGVLTRYKLNRKEYSKQCVVTALIQIENAHLY